jgi:Zn finger protein HypA/HybF involved in hydrogenase expression
MIIQCPKCTEYFEPELSQFYTTHLECPHCHTKWDIKVELFEVKE